MSDITTGGDRRVQLTDGVSFVARPEDAAKLPAGWVPLASLPLVVLVGVTGVGKSTTLGRLRADGVAFSLLPDRRVVADEVIIGTIQALDGQPPHPVTDRARRFEYTARYRKLFGGGVAHALTRLVVERDRWPAPLVFDGLRGREEVGHAVDHLPLSRFVVLTAPDDARVARLLGRADAFDQVAVAGGGGGATLTALRALPDIQAVFTEAQLERLAALAADEAGGEALVKNVAIVVAERRNYDPDGAREYLERHLSPERLLVVDTTTHDPAAVAGLIAGWLA